MSPIICTYNAPAKEFIAYRTDNLSHQVTVTDAAIDARAAEIQREAFDQAERSRAQREGPAFLAREFTATVESNQHRREQLAYELAAARLPEVEAPAE